MRGIEPLARRILGKAAAGVGFLDQGVSSATNFLAVILAASLLDRGAFGYFAMAYTCYLLVLGMVQAYVSQPLILRRGAGDAYGSQAVSDSLVVGAALAAVLAAGGAFLVSSMYQAPFFILSALLPLLMVQDVFRTIGVGVGRAQIALVSDLAWLVTFSSTVGLAAMRADALSAAVVMACWGGGGVVGAVVGAWLLRDELTWPSLRWPFRRAGLGGRFLMEHLLTQGANQAAVVAIGAVAGPAATGAIRGATTLFGPSGVVISAAPIMLVPPLRALSGNKRRFALAGLSIGFAMVPLSLLMFYLAVPSSVGTALLGSTWEGARPLMTPIGLQFAAIGVGTVGFTALRLAEPRGTLSIKVVGSAVFMVAFWGGYAIGGLEAAAWGLFLGSAVQATLMWVRYAAGPGWDEKA